ncbi:FKBP12-associated protein [Didymella keratinophila]|nr:FKBP12-associated protein [Didymella keratinophila]
MPSEIPGSTPAPASARGGHRGRGGPGRGGAQRFPQRTVAGGRQFGGQLTTEDDAESAASASLQADAPEFEPGRPLVGRKPRAPKEKQPQLPKSTAPDIATRTHEDIDNGHYECAICTEDIKRRSKGVWSCRTCWTVFHLGCIKKWSTNEGSAAARQQAQDGEAPPPRQWRCPGCNLPKDVLPKNFSCWCEKELDPKPVTGEGNGKKTLKCDEECARLERNRKLALALNVDPEHETDHVPYSDITLNLYVEHSTWAATHEKRLRLFAADDDEKRLRFKPMPKHQRKFIHYLAEDFGFDTESMDPEPHRHVAVFKTPKFVMAPMKTLAECARTRQVQRPIPVAPAAAPLRPKPSNTTGDPYNSFLILNPRFALTIEEVGMVIKNVLPQTNFPLEFDISFLPSEAVSLKPPLAARLSIPEREVQTMLESVKTPLSQAFAAQKVGSLQLARTDASLNVLRKESDIGPGSGWSQVAASRGIPSRQVQKSTPFGNKGGFAVLSLSSKKKKEKPAPVVDDWEAAEEEEEEKEEKDKASGANSGVVSEDDGPSRPRSRGLVEASADEAPISSKPGELLGRWSDLDDE